MSNMSIIILAIVVVFVLIIVALIFHFRKKVSADETARKQKEEEQANIQPLYKTQYVPAKALKDKVLLYVEDDNDLREYVQAEMEEICRAVVTAYNGKKALEYMAEHNVDVVVTDVMMPEIDGLELCQRIKSEPKWQRIPVIMLSARADAESIQRGYDAQADYYMDKPFDIERLVDVLEKTIAK